VIQSTQAETSGSLEQTLSDTLTVTTGAVGVKCVPTYGVESLGNGPSGKWSFLIRRSQTSAASRNYGFGIDQSENDDFVLRKGSTTSNTAWDVTLLRFSAAGDLTITPSGGVCNIAADLAVGAEHWHYIGLLADNGSWRIGRDGDDLVFQRRESGSWV